MKVKCINKKDGSIGFQGDINNKQDEQEVLKMCPKDKYNWNEIR